MSKGISGNAWPTIFNRGIVRDGRGEVVQEIEFVAHSIDPAEADAYWVAMSNVEDPPPELWVPMRPFSERVIGRPSRCTLPFLGTVRSFCHVPENVDFRLPLEGERADEPPEGFLLSCYGLREIAYEGFDENAWTGVVSMFGRARSLRNDRTLAQARSLRSDRALARAWSLCSDRAGRMFGRFVATDIGSDLVAT
ncbi:hypothetical protein F2Q70_00021790 [Brassica cretica]|uniref:Uncharacterized protein n=1 Tax=Brassica cretica TaxID=69181 RepID=A0A8S9GP32_BRACR|nr:hypothetical protein F2Q70_00021790 [Brassica cretica]